MQGRMHLSPQLAAWVASPPSAVASSSAGGCGGAFAPLYGPPRLTPLTGALVLYDGGPARCCEEEEEKEGEYAAEERHLDALPTPFGSPMDLG